MEQEQLNNILKKHELWLKGETGGERANLEYVNLERANLEGVNLEGANLYRTNLRGAILYDANLIGANLEDANLRYANLGGVNLKHANLGHANLEYVNLERANLEGVNLEGANLYRTNLGGATLDYQLQPNLLHQIAVTVLSDKGNLEMVRWHTCDTTHCLAGWACHLNETAKQLEFTHGTQIAGLLTLGQEAHSYFFKGNEETLEYLKQLTKDNNNA